MASVKSLALGRSSEVMFFNPEEIEEYPGLNVRNYDSPEVSDHIRKIANCVKENGVMSIEPIAVFQENGKLYVSRGHCRRRGHILARQEGADFKGIRATVDTMTEQARVLDLLNSNSGLPLTMLEKAEVVKRLLNFGWSVADIAKKHGVSTAAINNLLTLQEAPEAIKEMVSEGTISPTLALETVAQQGAEKAEETLIEVVQVAKSKGKKKVTNKDMKPSGRGLSVYTGKGKLPDLFVEDPDTGIFPCSSCIHRAEYEVCSGCKHYVMEEDE